MLRHRFLVLGFMVCLLTATLLVAGSPTTSNQLTVGDFAVMMASKMASGEAEGSLTPEKAGELLRKYGVNVDAKLSSPLTERTAADLFQQVGITLQAQHPDELLSRERAIAVIGVFGDTLSSAGTAHSALLKAKGGSQKASVGATASLDVTPLDCQMLVRDPANDEACESPDPPPQSVCNPCQDCCKNQLSLTGKQCGKLCQKKNLVITPTEPTP